MGTYLRKNRVVDMVLAKAELENAKRIKNEYDDVAGEMVEGAIGNLFADGIEDEITNDDVFDWLTNPDEYWRDIQDYMMYLYYSNGTIYQLYTIIKTLPDLNYSIHSLDASGNDKNLSTLKQILRKVKHKELTRDLLVQSCVNGTVVCSWMGDKKNPYLHIFDKTQYVFPKYRRNGEWVAVVDLAMFDDMDEEEERTIWLDILKDVVSENDYNNYQNNISDESLRYIELPQETTKVIRVNTLFRNQRIGIPMGTQYLYDLVHKNSYKNLESTIIKKAIRNVATLSIGTKEVPYLDINKNVRKTVANGVYNTLQKSISSNGTPVVVLPEWAKLEFAGLEGMNGLDADKYEAIDNDSSIDSGLPTPMFTGKDGTSASMKYAYTFLYKRIAEILEQIDDVYNKLFYVILGKKSENFWFEYDKGIPLETSDVLGTLKNLHSEGFAVKPVLDMMPSIDFDDFIAQTLYEQQDLKLYETVVPPATSYTQSSSEDNEGGRPEKQDTELSEEGERTRDENKNER